MGTKLNNYYQYIHIDKIDINIMGKPEANENIAKTIPLVAEELVARLSDGHMRHNPINETTDGFKYILVVEYMTGSIIIKYNKTFRNPKERQKADEYDKFIMCSIVCTNYDKLHYTEHQQTCLLLDEILHKNYDTRDYHIRRAEIASDTIDKEVGEYLAMATVLNRSPHVGWEFKRVNGLAIKRKNWLPKAEGQYYLGGKFDCNKKRKYRRRELNVHIHWAGMIPIYRIELRLSRNWLADKKRKIRTCEQLLAKMQEIFLDNVKFMRPELESIRKFLFRCRQTKKYPEFIRKSWNSYLEWEQYSTSAWMYDLQRRTGKSVSKYFYEIETPEILVAGHRFTGALSAQNN